MGKKRGEFRGLAQVGLDLSLLNRIENCAYHLMRAKGLYRDRLIDLNLELSPLRPEDFTEAAGVEFEELVQIISGLDSGINVGFGHFKDPSSKQRERIAELVLKLVQMCSVAENLADTLPTS